MAVELRSPRREQRRRNDDTRRRTGASAVGRGSSQSGDQGQAAHQGGAAHGPRVVLFWLLLLGMAGRTIDECRLWRPPPVRRENESAARRRQAGRHPRARSSSTVLGSDGEWEKRRRNGVLLLSARPSEAAA